MRLRFVVFIFWICIIKSTEFYAKIVMISSSSDLNRMENPRTRYIIKGFIDLKEHTIEMPPHSILEFEEGGQFINGVIIGNNTVVKAPQKLIFKNVGIEGTWSNSKVYSNWTDLKEGLVDNNLVFHNLMVLCGGTRYTHFFMQEGTYYVSAIKGSASIKVPSNIYWHNSATIKMLPNNYEKYVMIYINMVDNVTIEGGCFVGDVENHTGNTGEWGHGIKCGGARKVTLKNLTCSCFWGDGIDLIEGLQNGQISNGCENITIDNVKCLNNRRQGMSIEAASNVRVSNSEFAYTGVPKYTPPGAGVNIEPWDNSCDKVWNVNFSNCSMHHNRNFDFICEPNVLRNNVYKQLKLKNNISVSDCQMGFVLVRYTYGVRFSKSNIYNHLSMAMTEDIQIKNSFVEKYSKTEDVHKLVFKGCKGSGF